MDATLKGSTDHKRQVVLPQAGLRGSMAIRHTLAALGLNDSTGGFCCEQTDYSTTQGRRQAWGRDDCECVPVETRQEYVIGGEARRPALRESPLGSIPGRHSPVSELGIASRRVSSPRVLGTGRTGVARKTRSLLAMTGTEMIAYTLR